MGLYLKVITISQKYYVYVIEKKTHPGISFIKRLITFLACPYVKKNKNAAGFLAAGL